MEAVKNVISVGRSAILLVPAPNQRVPEPLTTVEEEEAVTVEEEVEATMLSEAEAEARRPGMIGHRFRVMELA